MKQHNEKIEFNGLDLIIEFLNCPKTINFAEAAKSMAEQICDQRKKLAHIHPFTCDEELYIEYNHRKNENCSYSPYSNVIELGRSDVKVRKNGSLRIKRGSLEAELRHYAYDLALMNRTGLDRRLILQKYPAGLLDMVEETIDTLRFLHGNFKRVLDRSERYSLLDLFEFRGNIRFGHENAEKIINIGKSYVLSGASPERVERSIVEFFLEAPLRDTPKEWIIGNSILWAEGKRPAEYYDRPDELDKMIRLLAIYHDCISDVESGENPAERARIFLQFLHPKHEKIFKAIESYREFSNYIVETYPKRLHLPASLPRTLSTNKMKEYYARLEEDLMESPLAYPAPNNKTYATQMQYFRDEEVIREVIESNLKPKPIQVTK